MYQIKQKPEDFVVREISNVEIKDSGKFSYFLLKKKNYNTLRALEMIAKQLRIPLKKLGFAGNKDRKAITSQLCSVDRVSESRLKSIDITDISVEFKGKGDSPICLGDLEGNSFEIIVRNIDFKPELKKTFVNYFGEQRFSKNNALIGKSIIKKDFKTAVKLVLEGFGEVEKKVKEFLEQNPNNYVGALKCVPKKILSLYVHAYQSLLWNMQAEMQEKQSFSAPQTQEKSKDFSGHRKIKDFPREPKVSVGTQEKIVPLVGFATEIDKEIMENEKITTRDFVIKQIPQLSSEGGERNRIVKAKNISISELEEDEMNKGKQKVLIKFVLPKGSYATEFVKSLFPASATVN